MKTTLSPTTRALTASVAARLRILAQHVRERDEFTPDDAEILFEVVGTLLAVDILSSDGLGAILAKHQGALDAGQAVVTNSTAFIEDVAGQLDAVAGSEQPTTPTTPAQYGARLDDLLAGRLPS